MLISSHTAFNNWYELSRKLWLILQILITLPTGQNRHRSTPRNNWIRYLEYLNCFQTLENGLRRLKKNTLENNRL